jgi:hypothetical protein
MKKIIILLVITFSLATISDVKAQHLRVCTVDSLGNHTHKDYENLNRTPSSPSEATQVPISQPAPERLDTFWVNPNHRAQAIKLQKMKQHNYMAKMQKSAADSAKKAPPVAIPDQHTEQPK